MIDFSDFLDWKPDNIGEDRVDLVIINALLHDPWKLVYHNPPSGSWKVLSIYDNQYEYRQIGPKRGVARMKRPDVVLQDMSRHSDNPRFMLIESKVKREDYDSSLPDLMRAYFEDQDEGVKRLPFDHRRPLSLNSPWINITDDNQSRSWFSNATADYIYGFAYGPILTGNIEDESEWTTSLLNSIEETVSPIPIFIISVGFDPDDMAATVCFDFSSSIPEEVRDFIQSRLEQVNNSH